MFSNVHIDSAHNVDVAQFKLHSDISRSFTYFLCTQEEIQWAINCSNNSLFEINIIELCNWAKFVKLCFGNVGGKKSSNTYKRKENSIRSGHLIPVQTSLFYCSINPVCFHTDSQMTHCPTLHKALVANIFSGWQQSSGCSKYIHCTSLYNRGCVWIKKGICGMIGSFQRLKFQYYERFLFILGPTLQHTWTPIFLSKIYTLDWTA